MTDLEQAIRYVKTELSKRRAPADEPITADGVRDMLMDVFSDLEHALSHLEMGDWEVDHWGKLQPK